GNLRTPPVRERRGDIPVLAMHFLERMQRETGVAHTFSDDMLRVMAEYDWPGNVRELENAIERACALSSGPVLHMGDLPTQLQDFRLQQGPAVRTTEEDGAERSEGVRTAGGEIEIGRASCKERGEIEAGGGVVRVKRKRERVL